MTKKQHKHILIVDDNPIIRKVISEMLKAKDFIFDEASNGMEAVKMVSEKVYSIILMDLLMPSMSGFEATQKIREMGITTPIIAQSSMSSRDDQRRSLEAGCNAFIPKPFNRKDLNDLVNKLISEEPRDAQEHAAPEIVRALSDKSSIIKDYKVLLVEEDKDQAVFITKLLQKCGPQVTHVATGELAWKLFKQQKQKFDIVISNIFTSGIDGLGLLVNIKKTDNQQPVLMYTGAYDSNTFQHALELGADGIIPAAKLKDKTIEHIESALYHSRGERSFTEGNYIVRQIRESQTRLIESSEINKNKYIDPGYMSLHEAGGDLVYHRQFNRAGRIGMALLDVAGHDIKSSYISAIALGILASIWNSHQDPMDLLNHLNFELLKMGDGSLQICTTAILWDQRRSKIRVAYAGNPGGLYLKKSGNGLLNPIELEGGGLCLGMLKRTDLYISQEIDFTPGSFLYFFSDGIEIEQLTNTLSQNNFSLGDGIKGKSQKIIESFYKSGSQEDDMILLAFESPEPFPEKGVYFYIKSNLEEVNRACQLVADEIIKADVVDDIYNEFLYLSIRETILNAVEHGNSNNPDAYVDISLYFDPDELRVEISDEGSGFDLPEKLSEAKSHDGLQIGKRGLPLMNAAADNVEIEGGTVSLIFHRGKKNM